MSRLADTGFEPLTADKAIDLYNALLIARHLQLHPALARGVRELGVTVIDEELHRLVPGEALSHVAALGLRGELVFPVPAVIRQAPPLLGYYRMLLVLLTLGPSLQGSRNTTIGSTAIRKVFNAVRGLLAAWIVFETQHQLIRFSMPNGQTFQLLAGSDPDLRVDALVGTAVEPRLAIEVKGGTDPSNVHNRAGEAEKSQIKARAAGYDQRWTIIGMRNVAAERIKAQTPTSTRVYDAREIMEQAGPDWDRFRHDLGMVVGQAGL